MQDILTKTIDNGVIEEIQISPIGIFNGSDVNGNPVVEHITEESLQKLADKLNADDEKLLDKDHSSCKIGNDKNSRACGWLSRWIVKPFQGLFAKLTLTGYGKSLIENREYRYTSPVFSLNEDGTVADLHSVALTNVPAFRGHLKPILNQEASQIIEKDYKDIESMDINELKKLIIETISEVEAEKQKKEIVEEIKEEIVANSDCSQDEKKEEMVSNEETTEEVKVEEVKTVETPVVEEKKEEEEEKEVIKIEALNSAPKISLNSTPAWKTLKGKEFFDWLEKHPKGV